MKEIEVNVTLDDFLAYCKYVGKTKKDNSLVILIVLITLGGQGITMAFYEFDLVRFYIQIALAYLLGIVALFVRNRYVINEINRQAYLFQGITGNNAYSFSIEGVVVQNQFVKLEIPKSSIIELQETPKYFFLKIKTPDVLIIPKRTFQNEDELMAFKNVIDSLTHK